MLNGIQWWWRHGRPGPGGTLPLLDPDGALWREVRPERTIGCVIYCPCELVEPGVISHVGSNHFILGEPDGSSSARLEQAVAMLRRGGIDGRASSDLRRDIWGKLVSNASGNTIAALTRLDLGALAADPDLSGQRVSGMEEVLADAAALGWDLRGQMALPAIARRGTWGQRPSMLQDVLQGRPIEVEALFGQVHAFAHEAGVPVTTMDAILPLLRGLGAHARRGQLDVGLGARERVRALCGLAAALYAARALYVRLGGGVRAHSCAQFQARPGMMVASCTSTVSCAGSSARSAALPPSRAPRHSDSTTPNS
jgi:2-dehydropantoate 2-reductase